MSFHINDKKLLQKYKAIWTKIEDLKNIELNALTVCDDRYMKTKIRTYGNKVNTNFCGLNVPEGYIYWQKFIDISERIDPIKSNRSKEYMICQYWFFNHGFNFQDSVCNGYRDFMIWPC